MRLGLPVVLNHGAVSLMQFTDAWIVSGLGNADALAALGTSSILLAIFVVFGAEFMTGVSTLTAQARGRRGRKQHSRYGCSTGRAPATIGTPSCSATGYWHQVLLLMYL